MKVERRRYLAALQKVRERAPLSDDEFARELGLCPETREAAIAIGVRRAVGDWLRIPAESIRGATSWANDSDIRPLRDSLYLVDLVFQIEKRTNLSIPLSVLSALPSPDNATVGETIRAILNLIIQPSPAIKLTIRIKERDKDNWLARVPELYGVVVHGRSREETVAYAKSAALRKLAQRLRRIVPETAVTAEHAE